MGNVGINSSEVQAGAKCMANAQQMIGSLKSLGSLDSNARKLINKGSFDDKNQLDKCKYQFNQTIGRLNDVLAQLGMMEVEGDRAWSIRDKAAYGGLLVLEGLLGVGENIVDGVASLLGFIGFDTEAFIEKQWVGDTFNAIYDSNGWDNTLISDTAAKWLKIGGSVAGYVGLGFVTGGMVNPSNLLGVMAVEGTAGALTGMGRTTEEQLVAGADFRTALKAGATQGVKDGLLDAALSGAAGAVAKGLSGAKAGQKGLGKMYTKAMGAVDDGIIAPRGAIRGADNMAGAITRAGGDTIETARVLATKGADSATIARGLANASANVDEIGAGLIKGGKSLDEVTDVVRAIGGSSEDVASAVFKAGGNANDALTAVTRAGGNLDNLAAGAIRAADDPIKAASTISDVVRNAGGSMDNVAAGVFKTAGNNVDTAIDMAKQMGMRGEEIASGMVRAGNSVDDVMKITTKVGSTSDELAVGILKAADEPASVLPKLRTAGIGDNALLKAIANSGMDAKKAGNLLTTITKDTDTIASVLVQSGKSADNVVDVMKNVAKNDVIASSLKKTSLSNVDIVQAMSKNADNVGDTVKTLKKAGIDNFGELAEGLAKNGIKPDDAIKAFGSKAMAQNADEIYSGLIKGTDNIDDVLSSANVSKHLKNASPQDVIDFVKGHGGSLDQIGKTALNKASGSLDDAVITLKNSGMDLQEVTASLAKNANSGDELLTSLQKVYPSNAGADLKISRGLLQGGAGDDAVKLLVNNGDNLSTVVNKLKNTGDLDVLTKGLANNIPNGSSIDDVIKAVDAIPNGNKSLIVKGLAESSSNLDDAMRACKNLGDDVIAKGLATSNKGIDDILKVSKATGVDIPLDKMVSNIADNLPKGSTVQDLVEGVTKLDKSADSMYDLMKGLDSCNVKVDVSEVSKLVRNADGDLSGIAKRVFENNTLNKVTNIDDSLTTLKKAGLSFDEMTSGALNLKPDILNDAADVKKFIDGGASAADLATGISKSGNTITDTMVNAITKNGGDLADITTGYVRGTADLTNGGLGKALDALGNAKIDPNDMMRGLGKLDDVKLSDVIAVANDTNITKFNLSDLGDGVSNYIKGVNPNATKYDEITKVLFDNGKSIDDTLTVFKNSNINNALEEAGGSLVRNGQKMEDVFNALGNQGLDAAKKIEVSAAGFSKGNKSAEEIIDFLSDASRKGDFKDITKGMINGGKKGDELVEALMKKTAPTGTSKMANFKYKVFRKGTSQIEEVTKIVKEAGGELSDITAGILRSSKTRPKTIVKIIKKNGGTIQDVASGYAKVGKNADETFKILRKAGGKVDEIGEGLIKGGANIEEVVDAMSKANNRGVRSVLMSGTPQTRLASAKYAARYGVIPGLIAQREPGVGIGSGGSNLIVPDVDNDTSTPPGPGPVPNNTGGGGGGGGSPDGGTDPVKPEETKPEETKPEETKPETSTGGNGGGGVTPIAKTEEEVEEDLEEEPEGDGTLIDDNSEEYIEEELNLFDNPNSEVVLDNSGVTKTKDNKFGINLAAGLIGLAGAAGVVGALVSDKDNEEETDEDEEYEEDDEYDDY